MSRTRDDETVRVDEEAGVRAVRTRYIWLMVSMLVCVPVCIAGIVAAAVRTHVWWPGNMSAYDHHVFAGEFNIIYSSAFASGVTVLGGAYQALGVHPDTGGTVADLTRRVNRALAAETIVFLAFFTTTISALSSANSAIFNLLSAALLCMALAGDANRNPNTPSGKVMSKRQWILPLLVVAFLSIMRISFTSFATHHVEREFRHKGIVWFMGFAFVTDVFTVLSFSAFLATAAAKSPIASLWAGNFCRIIQTVAGVALLVAVNVCSLRKGVGSS